MAITGVLRPGHAQIRVLDLEESLHFYRNILGLVETGKDASGRHYFKGWDERDHHSVIIRQADRAGIDFFGFRVLDVATLNQLEKDLNAYGVKTERIPAGDLLETGERVRFEAPTGHLFELYAEKTHVGNGSGLLNPAPWNRKTAEHGIAPFRMDHGLLYGPNIEATKELFTKVLGFRVVEYVVGPEGSIAAYFLSCSHKAHDIAIGEHPEPGKLHHISYRLESWEKVLRSADIIGMNKVPVELSPTRHGVTRGTTIYAWDPSGNRFETFCGSYEPYPDWEPIKWTFDEFGYGFDHTTGKFLESFFTIVT
jgi:catechol 2,3-dioxygenase